MKVNVITSVEREIEIDDKFQIMNLLEYDDKQNKISNSLYKELSRAVKDDLFLSYPELEEFIIEKVYSTKSGETIYKRDQK